MTRVYNILFILACMILTGIACRQEPGNGGEDRGFQLNAANIQMDGDTEPAAKAFQDNTKYAIFVINSATQDWANPILHEMGEEINGYIRIAETESYNGRSFDFYGLTLGTSDPIYTPETPDADAVEYAPGNSGNPPRYRLTATESEGNNGIFYHLPDLRRAELKGCNANNSEYTLQLPFKHSLAMLRLEVVRQDADELNDASIEYVKLIGSHKTGNLDVATGNYSFEAGDRTDILLYENTGGNRPIPSEGGDSLCQSLIFPYDPAQNNDTPLRLEIMTNKPTIGNNGLTTCNLVTVIGSDIQNLQVRSNVIYTVRINVTTDEVRVLTIVPSYFEWIEEDLAEVDMGVPVNFNGVLWSDRNLGATNAHPLESSDAWNESVGYFYQFGRNIPYFPNDPIYSGSYWNRYISGVNLNTPLDEALKSYNASNGEGRIAYPVVTLSSWNLQNINPDNIIWAAGDAGSYNANTIIWQIDDFPSQNRNNSYLLGYYKNTASIPNANTNWSNKENHPCPAGWRLPTNEEWKSIMPYSPISGNIALRVFTGSVNDQGDWAVSSNSEPNFEYEYKDRIAFHTTPTGGTSPYTTHERAYYGEFPLVIRYEENDPRPGRRSTYIISFDGDDWQKYDCYNPTRTPNRSHYTYNWGVIYCIKNVGTNEAYRLRWRIVLVGTEDQIRQDPRSVIVIERYPAQPTDNLTQENVKSYDWSHPVEVLYLPITGMLSQNWPNSGVGPGALFNIGGEVAYASSEAHPTLDNVCYGCWIKNVGDNMTNMQMSASSTVKGFGMQVRCVRDTEY